MFFSKGCIFNSSIFLALLMCFTGLVYFAVDAIIINNPHPVPEHIKCGLIPNNSNSLSLTNYKQGWNKMYDVQIGGAKYGAIHTIAQNGFYGGGNNNFVILGGVDAGFLFGIEIMNCRFDINGYANDATKIYEIGVSNFGDNITFKITDANNRTNYYIADMIIKFSPTQRVTSSSDIINDFEFDILDQNNVIVTHVKFNAFTRSWDLTGITINALVPFSIVRHITYEYMHYVPQKQIADIVVAVIAVTGLIYLVLLMGICTGCGGGALFFNRRTFNESKSMTVSLIANEV